MVVVVDVVTEWVILDGGEFDHVHSSRTSYEGYFLLHIYIHTYVYSMDLPPFRFWGWSVVDGGWINRVAAAVVDVVLVLVVGCLLSFPPQNYTLNKSMCRTFALPHRTLGAIVLYRQYRNDREANAAAGMLAG
jgi:hypothetical protein